MKIEVSQEKLNKALTNVSRIAVGKVTLPILNNALIRVDDKKVSIITTNLDMAIIDFLPVSSSENGVITLPAKLLAEFISNLPKDEKVEITSKNNKATIKAGKYSSVINGSSADDFPELPEINEKTAVIYKIDINDFKDSINEVMIATSNDLTRPALTGVYFNTINNSLHIAATDGYRLAEKQIIDKVENEISAIVPASSLQEVLRAINDSIEEIEITFNDDLVRFRLGEIEIISKLIDASFPDYQKLIPKENKIKVSLNRDELLRVTKLAALFSRSIGGSIICETKKPNLFSVKSITNEFGENNSDIETTIKEEGKISLNSRFLIDALNSLEESEIDLEFSNSLSPILLKNKKNNKYNHIIMPLNS